MLAVSEKEQNVPETLERPTKTRRKSWTQAEVAELVTHFHTALVGSPAGAYGERSAAEVNAKLIELGLLEKPEKPTLPDDYRKDIDDALAVIADSHEPMRTLAIRYTLRSLKALLPKRPSK